jgi:hypothetical protein
MIDFSETSQIPPQDDVTNTPHWADKRDAAAIAVPGIPKGQHLSLGYLDNPNERNEIAIAEENYAEAIEPLTESDSWRDRIEGRLAAIQLMLSKEYLQPEEDEWVTLLASKEYVMRRKGRRYLCLWSPTALTGCTFSVLGQVATLNLVAGWQNLSLPEGTTLQLATGATAQLVLTRATNWNYGAAI